MRHFHVSLQGCTQPMARCLSAKRFAVAGLVTAGLVTLGLPGVAIDTLSQEDYELCAASLREAGVADADAAAACARALSPQDVARCVVQAKVGSALTANDFLAACRRVRRPVELATCFTRIRTADTTAAEGEVLENCRRSLLPERFSNCVVGLRANIQFSTAEALQTCIAAGDRPQNVLPSFIPQQ